MGAAGHPQAVVAPTAPSLAPVALSLPPEAPGGLQPSVVPVAPEPEVIDAARLVATVQRIERQVVEAKAAAERTAAQAATTEAGAAATRATATPEKAHPSAASGDCGLDTSGLGAVTRGARAAAEFLGCRFGEPTMYGVAGRAGSSDHPSGRAVDFMVDPATGNGLAACALDNMDALGITYVIWRQRINYGSGWVAMEDRGGATANHMDHVHVSFGFGPGSGPPVAC